MLKRKSLYLISFLLFFCATIIYAQEEVIVAGQVVDKSDKKPIATATVSFAGNDISTSTDDNGFFLLRSQTPQEKVIVSMLGYKTKTINLKDNYNLGIQVKLSENLTVLGSVVVFGSREQENKLMERVRAARKYNDPTSFEGYNPVLTVTTKASLQQLSKFVLNRKIIEQLQSYMIHDKDTSLLLPVYSSTESYRILNKQKEVISFEQKSIVPEHAQSIEALSSRLPAEINFYNNYILLFGKNFLSPIAGSSRLVYKYTIMDSIRSPQGKEYIVNFKPNNNKDLLFEGTMHIDSLTCSLKKISASMLASVNLNFIQQLNIDQTFIHISPNKWVVDEQQTLVNAQLISKERKANSFFVSRNIIYSDSLAHVERVVVDTIAYKDNFTNAIDSISHTRAARITDAISYTLTNSYVSLGPFDWGPWYLAVGTNKPEGTHFTLGGRTNKHLFENMTIGAYGSYGTTDEKWKFGGEFQYRFKKKNYELLGIKFDDNYYQTDYDYHDEIYFENAVGNGIADITTFIISGFSEKYSRRQIASLFYKKEWWNGVNTNMMGQFTKYLPNEYVPYQTENTQYPWLKDYRITFDLRLSRNERYMDEFFHRVFLKNNLPVIHFVAEGGRYFLTDQSNYYLKLHLMEKQTILLGNVGKLNYSLQAGYIFGKVPFPLLEIYSGIENYGFEKLNLFLLSFEQYASDAYAGVETQFVTNGFIFNKIPVVKWLNLREIVSLKIATGRLSDRNSSIMQFPSFIKPMEEPYMMVGVGITNLFKIIALEYIMEMPRMSRPNELTWNFRARMFFDM